MSIRFHYRGFSRSWSSSPSCGAVWNNTASGNCNLYPYKVILFASVCGGYGSHYSYVWYHHDTEISSYNFRFYDITRDFFHLTGCLIYALFFYRRLHRWRQSAVRRCRHNQWCCSHDRGGPNTKSVLIVAFCTSFCHYSIKRWNFLLLFFVPFCHSWIDGIVLICSAIYLGLLYFRSLFL